ncbi:UrcA family protein [Sphingomonas sp. KR3-1]|uniref:UrcA family protein n=1 Tax=Sphingomonas sp. KR3-1 TaxID=3156611 RepID=UPI0032B42341
MTLAHHIACCVAGSLLVPAAVLAQSQDDRNSITVTAPRHGGSPGDMTDTVAHSVKVDVSDLDLTTAAGLAAAQTRFGAAARKSCDWLDAHYPVVDSTSGCVKDAVDRAMASARAVAGQ